MGWLKAGLYAVVAVVLIYMCMEGLIHADRWSGAIPTIIPGFLGGSIVPPLVCFSQAWLKSLAFRRRMNQGPVNKVRQI